MKESATLKRNSQLSILASLKTFFYLCRQVKRRQDRQGLQLTLTRASFLKSHQKQRSFAFRLLKSHRKCQESNPRPQLQEHKATAINKKTIISVKPHLASFLAQLLPLLNFYFEMLMTLTAGSKCRKVKETGQIKAQPDFTLVS